MSGESKLSVTTTRKLFTLRRWSLAFVILSLSWPSEIGLAEPLLSYVIEDDGGAEWHIWDAALSRDRLFLDLPQAPEHSYWDPAAREVYFVVDRGIYRARYDQVPGHAERLGPAPEAPGEIEILWREAQDGSLRAITIYYVPDADLIEDGEALTYRLPDGSIIPGIPDPKWLVYMVCTLEKMTSPDTWSTRVQMADSWSYEGVPCIRLDISSRKESGISQFSLYQSYRCASSDLCDREAPLAVRPKFEALMAAGVPFDFVGYLGPSNTTHGLAFGVVEAHGLHAYGQVFVVAPDEGSIEPLELAVGPQFQIGHAKGYVLIAEEYSGADPHVIDLASGRVVFRADGRSALWVPE